MTRPPRLELPNGVYHVSARGNERSAIYRDDGDRRRFLELLAQARARFGWRVLAYCLMANHYHLLVQTPDPNLSRGMRELNGVYAQWFNRRHARVGHVFQGRFSARLVQEDGHLLAVVRYVVRNPVRAGLCREPGEWRWSSYRSTLADVPSPVLDPDVLLAFYAATPQAARGRFREQCAEDGDAGLPAHPLAVGDEAFVRATLERAPRAPGIPDRYFREPRPGLAELLAPGDTAAVVAAQGHGYSLREIARLLGVHPSTLSRRLRSRSERRFAATPRT